MPARYWIAFFFLQISCFAAFALAAAAIAGFDDACAAELVGMPRKSQSVPPDVCATASVAASHTTRTHGTQRMRRVERPPWPAPVGRLDSPMATFTRAFPGDLVVLPHPCSSETPPLSRTANVSSGASVHRGASTLVGGFAHRTGETTGFPSHDGWLGRARGEEYADQAGTLPGQPPGEPPWPATRS